MVHIAEFIQSYGYAGLFVIVFLESSFVFPLPGDSLLFLAGIAAAQMKFGLTLPILLAIFIISAFLGSLLGYEIGYYSLWLSRFKLFKRVLNREHIDKVHVFFERYGKLAMIVSRFVPMVRTFTPIAAGMGRMNYGQFLRYNILGAAIWSVLITCLGFYLGRTFPQISDYISYIVIAIILVSLLPAIYHHYRKRKGERSLE
jgi:membrane-associated protein